MDNHEEEKEPLIGGEDLKAINQKLLAMVGLLAPALIHANERSVCSARPGGTYLEVLTEYEAIRVRACGSNTFELHCEGINQGDLCDVHYWKNRAEISWRAALEDAANKFDGTTAYNFTAADGYTNVFDIASELRYMATETPQERVLSGQPDEMPLRCKAVAGEIDLRVGVETLRFAAKNHEEFWDGESGTDVPAIKITNSVIFAQEVVLAINEEAEDGSTLLSRMLDEAIKQAVENGCEGVDHDSY